MGKIAFIRLAEVINRKQDMRVVSVTVKPTITDCSGTIYFTDLQLQEGAALTGYTPHTEVFLQGYRNGRRHLHSPGRSPSSSLRDGIGGLLHRAFCTQPLHRL